MVAQSQGTVVHRLSSRLAVDVALSEDLELRPDSAAHTQRRGLVAEVEGSPGQLIVLSRLHLHGVDNVGVQALARLVIHMPAASVILDEEGGAGAAIVGIGQGVAVTLVVYIADALGVIDLPPLDALIQILAHLKGVHLAGGGMTEDKVALHAVDGLGGKAGAGEIALIDAVDVWIQQALLHRSPGNTVLGMGPIDVPMGVVAGAGDHQHHDVLVAQAIHLMLVDLGVAGFIEAGAIGRELLCLHADIAIGPVDEVVR